MGPADDSIKKENENEDETCRVDSERGRKEGREREWLGGWLKSV